jgi:uncharacterized membrane protein YeaQ/YmgE (transglycosylase-associated protein family)
MGWRESGTAGADQQCRWRGESTEEVGFNGVDFLGYLRRHRRLAWQQARRQGWIANIILGIVGAVIGGIVWGWIDDEEFVIDWSIGSLILGVIGAFVVSWGYAYLMGRKA